jgi:chromosome segregation ATPase
VTSNTKDTRQKQEHSTESEPDRVLEHRRDQTKSVRKAAQKARNRVHELETEINSNATRAQDYEKALEKAKAEVEWLKQALKTTTKRGERLIVDRKKAGEESAKAQRKAEKVEAKYEESVLAEIVRREKLADLEAHTRSTSRRSRPDREATEQRTPDRETPDLATTTATEVAARTTTS